MSGLYIHIPFCKSRCIYCGFYSTTALAQMDDYVQRLLEDYKRQAPEFIERCGAFKTIYIGGGTPSVLGLERLKTLIAGVLESLYIGGKIQEFTVECNPDDVNSELIESLASLGVNRISMGVQSFDNQRLSFLHRRHTAEQAVRAVDTVRQHIDNISIDLIFGFPNQKLSDWEKDIDRALALNVPHISAYSLMYEEGTPLYRLLEEGKVAELDDEISRAMYYLLVDKLTAAGYEHYEISNFAKPGFRSMHNSSYWLGTPYLGIGTGAHSYDGTRRWWSEEGGVECELLTETDKYNDLITTRLRTKEGVPLALLMALAPEDSLNLNELTPRLSTLIEIKNDHLCLTRDGLYLSDSVMRELIIVSLTRA